MIADPLTKNHPGHYLRHVLNTGLWPIMEEGTALQCKALERKEGHQLLFLLLEIEVWTGVVSIGDFQQQGATGSEQSPLSLSLSLFSSVRQSVQPRRSDRHLSMAQAAWTQKGSVMDLV